MLSDLLIARLALRQPEPDLSRHAAMQCTFGKFRTNVAELARRIANRFRLAGN